MKLTYRTRTTPHIEQDLEDLGPRLAMQHATLLVPSRSVSGSPSNNELQVRRNLADPIAVFFIRPDDSSFSLPCKNPLQRRFDGVELCSAFAREAATAAWHLSFICFS
jgi:hypothetical protein